MSSTLLQAISKFDKRADYKVKPFVEPSNKESKELASYKNDDYPRASTRSIKDIEKLYNVRHDCYDYKSTIMESAHPDMLVLLPAYDKMNGLVENEMERQKINLNIMRKPVSGLEYRQKYAELVQALLKTANDMDFQNQTQLYKLADSTIEQLQKEALGLKDLERWFGDKTTDVEDVAGGATIGTIGGGLIGALLGGLPGALMGARIGGVAGGVISAVAKTGPAARNVQQNAKVALEDLNDLVKDHPADVFLSTLATSLTHIQDTATTYSNLVSKMQAQTAAPGSKSMSGQNADPEQVMQAGQQYIDEIHNLDAQIATFLANAQQGKYAPEESDLMGKIKSPFRGLFGDSVHDAVEAMEQLKRVSEAAVAGIQHAKEQASGLKTDEAPGEPDPNALEQYLKQFTQSK